MTKAFGLRFSGFSLANQATEPTASSAPIGNGRFVLLKYADGKRGYTVLLACPYETDCSSYSTLTMWQKSTPEGLREITLL
jgi:hypothetical protein